MPLWNARPRVTGDGRVEIECASCASGLRPIVVAAVEPAAVEPSRRAPPTRWFAAGGVVALAIASIAGADVLPAREAAGAIGAEPLEEVDSEIPDLDDELAGATSYGGPPTLPLPPVPERNGEPLDEYLPTLRGWVHPVPGSPEVIPRRASRVFGAVRTGAENDCGGGHCGVDLEGDRGQPVVAVAWGTVSRINHEEDRKGGKYVRIEHPDFVYTTYFHLDRIAPELEVGMEVEPGTPLGTLGATGIAISMPHLHFSLQIAEDAAGEDLKFIDPVPFLARAEVLARDAVPEIRK